MEITVLKNLTIMFWYIFPFIAFGILYWFFTVPHLIDDDEPIGLKMWMLILAIICSIIPVLNIVVVIVAIILFFVIACDQDLDFDDIFPDNEDENYKPSKLKKFLTKEIGKKK